MQFPSEQQLYKIFQSKLALVNKIVCYLILSSQKKEEKEKDEFFFQFAQHNRTWFQIPNAKLQIDF